MKTNQSIRSIPAGAVSLRYATFAAGAQTELVLSAPRYLTRSGCVAQSPSPNGHTRSGAQTARPRLTDAGKTLAHPAALVAAAIPYRKPSIDWRALSACNAIAYRLCRKAGVSPRHQAHTAARSAPARVMTPPRAAQAQYLQVFPAPHYR